MFFFLICQSANQGSNVRSLYNNFDNYNNVYRYFHQYTFSYTCKQYTYINGNRERWCLDGIAPIIKYDFTTQWNPSCKATPFAAEMWHFKRGGLSSGVEINTFMFRFTVSSDLSKGLASQQGCLTKGVPLYIIITNATLNDITTVTNLSCFWSSVVDCFVELAALLGLCWPVR